VPDGFHVLLGLVLVVVWVSSSGIHTGLVYSPVSDGFHVSFRPLARFVHKDPISARERERAREREERERLKGQYQSAPSGSYRKPKEA
jgi:hypothetical protein